MTQDASEVFNGLAITKEMAEAALIKAQRRRRNGGVCICGHAATAHTEFVPEGTSGVHDAARLTPEGATCAPSKHVCPCTKYQQVLEAKDVRRFRFATTGPGADHALMKGVVAAFQSEVDLWWDNDVECISCKLGMLTVGAQLAPVAYDKQWFEAKGPTDLNVMICVDCRDKIVREYAGVPEKRRA